MKKVHLFLMLLIGVMTINSVSATCTVAFDKESYSTQETITSSMMCDSASEKSTSYTLTWSYPNGTSLEVNNGVTPSTVGSDFFETYMIPLSYSGYINATLTGSSLEGSDFANVTGASATQLVLVNPSFVDKAFSGSLFGAKIEVNDENGKKVDGAMCSFYGTDVDRDPIQICRYNTGESKDGVYLCNDIVSGDFIEGQNYLVVFSCTCGVGDHACYDEDGTLIEKSSGSLETPFPLSTWLSVNTVTNKDEYNKKQEIFICANITSSDYHDRIPVDIYHQVRCSSGSDNSEDLDRALIVSDDGVPDKRGISVNSTQMQCKKFVIPESKHLQGKTSECYASTDVWVLDDNNNPVKGYHTTSPVFNITSTDINLNVDWQRTNGFTYNSIVNLSDIAYQDYSGEGIGQVDIRLSKINTESVDHTKQYGSTIVSFDTMMSSIYIKNVTATDINGTDLDIGIEYLEDGLLELEIRNVDMSPSGWYNVTLTLHNFEERSTEALEGINNSAGTFDFSITVPSTRFDHVTVAGEGLTGDGRTLNRDLNLKCQVDGHPETYTEFKVYCTDTFAFTQRIDNIPKTLDVYTMRCTAIDRFFGEDAVQAVANFERVSAGGGELPEEERKIPTVIIVLCILIAVILFCIILAFAFREDNNEEYEDFTRPE